MSQLPLAFPAADGRQAEDYVITPQNEEAYAYLARWPDWPQPAVLLLGPSGSGKTHLARLWAQRSAAEWLTKDAAPEASGPAVIDDAHRWPEEALFHCLNKQLLARSPLLVTAATLDGMALPDLRSRLASLPALQLPETDDTLLEAVLHSEFSSRQIGVSPDVIRYLLERGERSPAGMRRLVAHLDEASLTGKRAVNLKLARDILTDATLLD